MSRLKKMQTDNPAVKPSGKCQWIYGDEGEFEVYAVREGDATHTPWECRLSCPTTGACSNGYLANFKWTTESLLSACQTMLRLIRSVYGGKWYLDIRRKEHESRIFDKPIGTREKAERASREPGEGD